MDNGYGGFCKTIYYFPEAVQKEMSTFGMLKQDKIKISTLVVGLSRGWLSHLAKTI